MRKRTRKQIEAARANGSRSMGPVTEAGKSRSAANALKHTAYSEKILLHVEKDDEFNSLLAAYTEHWQPRNRHEYDLVRDIAIARWRLDRNVAAETASLGLEILRTEEYVHEEFTNVTGTDLIATAWSRLADRGRFLTLLGRQENSLRRTVARATAELRRLKADSACRKDARNEPDGQQLPLNQMFAGKSEAREIPQAD